MPLSGTWGVGLPGVAVFVAGGRVLVGVGVSSITMGVRVGVAVEVGGARGWESWAAIVGAEHSVSTIREALLPWLDPVVLPRRVRFVDALPREPGTGKLRRDDLRALFGS